jgi:protein ImuA
MRGRVHEASGRARRTFALWLAAQTKGPVFWIAPAWAQEVLHSDGVCAWLSPGRILFVSPKRAEDLLWSMEEVLRAGACPLCVADLPDLPSLTQVRRMHLAAESGGQTGLHLPLGLLLTPGEGGAGGVETRWHLTPRHSAGQDGWVLDRVRARTAPHKSWQIERSQKTQHLQIKTA